MKFFEDFKVGDEWQFEGWSVSREEALAFAKEYDPQPIHIDRDMASQTHFGDNLVSGWQTTLKTIRRFVDGVMKNTAGLASPGVEGIHWLKPVLPNEELNAGARVIKIKDSDSKPDRGMVWFELFAKNLKDEEVMKTQGLFFIAKKNELSKA